MPKGKIQQILQEKVEHKKKFLFEKKLDPYKEKDEQLEWIIRVMN